MIIQDLPNMNEWGTFANTRRLFQTLSQLRNACRVNITQESSHGLPNLAVTNQTVGPSLE